MKSIFTALIERESGASSASKFFYIRRYAQIYTRIENAILNLKQTPKNNLQLLKNNLIALEKSTCQIAQSTQRDLFPSLQSELFILAKSIYDLAQKERYYLQAMLTVLDVIRDLGNYEISLNLGIFYLGSLPGLPCK